MRETLFRGKSVNDGEWVFGSLVITTLEPVDDAPIKHYHIEDMTIGCFPNEFQSGLSETVDPNTVGQFTGLTDKNGKKIFEGDIVKASEKEDADLVGAVRWKFECWVVSGANWADSLNMANYLHKLEVIGNIHDNPELLEVE